MRCGKGAHGVGQIAPEPRLDEHVGELAACGLLRLLGHRLERLGDAEAAAERGGDQLQDVGQLVGERRLALGLRAADVDPHAEADDGRRQQAR